MVVLVRTPWAGPKEKWTFGEGEPAAGEKIAADGPDPLGDPGASGSFALPNEGMRVRPALPFKANEDRKPAGNDPPLASSDVCVRLERA